MLLTLFWVFWSLLASPASRSCARQGAAVVPAPAPAVVVAALAG
jgi:hypothetical protein